MPHRNQNPWILFVFIFILISLACGTTQPTPTPQPTATITAIIPTNILIATETPKPTQTPDIEATQRTDKFNAEAQSYFEKGYLTDPHGIVIEYKDYFVEWAQLGSYGMNKLDNKASDFFMSAHFIWESAYRNADTSGCGFAFAIQDNNEHYAVFLDRSKVYFVEANPYYRSVGLTRGSGYVKFDNPADKPVEADFTLIVKGTYAYVLVNNKLVGEYTLTQSRSLYGNIGLTVLSGTNKDYGTRCLMTNLHLWAPEED